MATVIAFTGATGQPASWPDRVIAAHAADEADPAWVVQPAGAGLAGITSVACGDVALLVFEWLDDGDPDLHNELVRWWEGQAGEPLVPTTQPVTFTDEADLVRYEIGLWNPPRPPGIPQTAPVSGQPCLRAVRR